MGGFLGTQSNQSQSSPYATSLARFGTQALKTAEPINATLGSQFLEALRTGGVNAFLPWIQRALDSVRQAGSNTIESARQLYARMGMGRSSQAAAGITEATQQANQAVAQTPEDLIMQFIQGAPGFAQGEFGQGGGLLSRAGGLNVNQTYTPSFWDVFNQLSNTGASARYAYSGGQP